MPFESDSQVEVLVRRLDPELPLPSYAHPGDAGLDLVTRVDIDLPPGERLLVPTGVAVALPAGYAGFVHPRSGLAAEHGLGIVNAPGTVDAGYRGEIKVLLINHDREQHVRLSRGHRIAQLVVQRVEQVSFTEVQLLPGSARGEGGYGSTGGAPPAATAEEPHAGTSQEATMSLFRRGNAGRSSPGAKKLAKTPAAEPPADDMPPRSGGGAATESRSSEAPSSAAQTRDRGDRPAVRARGPWDVSEVPNVADSGRLNLGGLWVPAFEGLEIRVEADPASGVVVSVTLVLDDSALQVQPFAAPRSGGIWEEVRSEMAAGLTQQGGTADLVDGPLGTELRAKVPVRRPDGSTGVEAARFLGVDGPRWFLRGALTGRAAAEPGVDDRLLDVFREVVVVRGATPMAPREAIPLVLPDAVQQTGPNDEEDPLQPFERGPEITEIR